MHIIDKDLLIKELKQLVADTYTARNLLLEGKHVLAYQKTQGLLTRSINILTAANNLSLIAPEIPEVQKEQPCS